MNMLYKIFKSFDSMKQMQIDKVRGKITQNITKYRKQTIFVNAFLVIRGIQINQLIINFNITFRTIMNMLCEIFKRFDWINIRHESKLNAWGTPKNEKKRKTWIRWMYIKISYFYYINYAHFFGENMCIIFW